MLRLTTLLLLLATVASAQRFDFTTRFERSGGIESSPYEEVIAYYRALDKAHLSIKMEEAGPTDTDYPLHVVYYSADKNFDHNRWQQQGKAILLINNGIHPGEPDGIDASMLLLRDAAAGKIRIPDNVVLAVVPVFNIGGALNRGKYSRANQNGPLEYGFRGNAQNLDLNRDFTKMDALETRSLVRLMTRLDPDLFIDNHVSNGADYQHVMTLLSTQADKLGTLMGPYLRDTLEPVIYAGMKARGYDLVPYVNSFEGTPDRGWPGFLDGPRYASGFAALFQIFSFVPETHMLKPYKQRVEATYALMQTFLEYAGSHSATLKTLRRAEREQWQSANQVPLRWTMDSSSHREVRFLGYEGKHKPSEVSGAPRLYYDRNQPITKLVPVYDRFASNDSDSGPMPELYVLPAGWQEVVQRLRAAGVVMQQLEQDSVLDVTAYHLDGYQTSRAPYEKHYLHYNIRASAMKSEKMLFRKGAWLISSRQPAGRYLAETLSPAAPDGFFAWNFFDAVLQQKEHYSDYVFEDEAAALLRDNPALRQQLNSAKAADSTLARDGAAQLDWVYRHSPRYEPVHLRYPVFMILRGWRPPGTPRF